VLSVVLALAPGAEAQEVTGSFWIYGPFGVDDLDGTLPPSAEVRLTLPLGGRFAIEPFVTAGVQGRRSDVEGFWGAQLRHRVSALSREDIYAFATYGAAFHYHSRYGSSSIPAGHFGFGLQQRLAGRVALRLDAHLVTLHVLPIGARFAAGLSVNLEH
jgi:hypothetical protein